MPSPRLSKYPFWLHLVSVVAASAKKKEIVHVVAAFVTGDLPFVQYLHQLVVPLGLTLLGLSSWLLARPRLHIPPNALPVPRLLSGLIAFFGVVCAVFACAELASSFADAGLVVLLDASLMFVALAGVILGVWCAIAGTTTLARSSRENAP